MEKKESRDIKNALLNSRISSQDSKESKEAIESIKKYYFQVFEEEKRNFLENKKRIENLNKNISQLLPDVIASADLIEFISLKKFIENYKK